MSKSSNFFKILEAKSVLENELKELQELQEEADAVFYFCTLEKISESYETTWQKLLKWNYKNVSKIRFGDVSLIHTAFRNVTNAITNRDEFKIALQPACESIDKAIEDIKIKISEIQKEIDKHYNKFVKTTGNYKFIFKEEQVKQLILSNLLK